VSGNGEVVRVRELKAWFPTSRGEVRAVDGVDFELERGRTFALLGESGCGKSMTALAMMRLMPPPGRVVEGAVELEGADLLGLSEARMREVRGRRMSMIFQEPQTSLNPVMSVGDQIGEALEYHLGLGAAARRERVRELLDAVGIPDPERRVEEYPHQLSGGMKQRVMIAMALACEPAVLIADEPTTALDVTIQAQVLRLLRGLQERTGMAVMLITHDLGVVAEVADEVAVMYAGHLVERAAVEEFFARPAHPYSRKLFASLPEVSRREGTLEVIRGSVPALHQRFAGCRFEPRCDFAWETCSDVVPGWSEAGVEHRVRCHLYDPACSEGTGPPPGTPARGGERERGARPAGGELLRVEQLAVHFPIRRGVLKQVVGHVRAVDGVSLRVAAGQTLALVGESGCGKTTAGKGILQLLRPSAGRVLYDGVELTETRGEALRARRKELQIIFQDPYASMNPRMMVGDIIEEGMIAQGMGAGRAERRARVAELLEQVGLGAESQHRYPHEFSGGQRQRICIARALAVEPRLIVCDEPTSALDVSVQAQILNLLRRLQRDFGLAYLFITHNISVVEYLAHEVAVMYLGRIVERGTVDEVLHDPKHPYTRALLSAVPVADPGRRREVIRLEGELPSPARPPRGCHFHPRCPEVMPHCAERYPQVRSLGATHAVHCYLYGEDGIGEEGVGEQAIGEAGAGGEGEAPAAGDR